MAGKGSADSSTASQGVDADHFLAIQLGDQIGAFARDAIRQSLLRDGNATPALSLVVQPTDADAPTARSGQEDPQGIPMRIADEYQKELAELGAAARVFAPKAAGLTGDVGLLVLLEEGYDYDVYMRLYELLYPIARNHREYDLRLEIYFSQQELEEAHDLDEWAEVVSGAIRS